MALSYAHHASVAIERAVAWMNDPDHCLAGGTRRIDTQLRQRMLTWHEHVASWLDHDDFPVHVVRYEDLSRAPEATLTGAARFLGLPHDSARIAAAVRHSAFNELKQQEGEVGFAERPAAAPTFFRQGRVGGWRWELDEREVAELVDHHGSMMMRLGYLGHDGLPR